jgi:hypothetical protein
MSPNTTPSAATTSAALASAVSGFCAARSATRWPRDYDPPIGELGDKLRGAIEPAIERGEELRGVCVASQQQGLFKGRQVAIGVTDVRLIVQGMTRKFELDGEPISLPPERIAEAKAAGAGGGWPEIGAAIMGRAAAKRTLKTTDGEKLKLTMMPGTGPLGGLGGGEDQRRGFEALAGWFAEHASADG